MSRDHTLQQRLNRQLNFDDCDVVPPIVEHFSLPEKVLQFGTGAFLRGFSNVFIDRANRSGSFGGRIVVVGSTGSGRASAINEQDGLYTIVVQGIVDGDVVDTCSIVGSVSRAIASTEEWSAVREFARSKDLQLVISNTTEVGIRFDPEDRPDLDPPRSFPGKLTALLHDRAETFDYAPESGLTILCCELIESNGDRLREIVLKLGQRWNLGERFTEWLEAHNRFCNTLVDRIVPGTPNDEVAKKLEDRLRYSDSLLVQAEPFCFWAIEGGDELRGDIPFADGESEIVVTHDIGPYRVRKVRVLNGGHSVMVPLSFLFGNDSVAETMEHPLTSEFLRRVILDEIVPSLEGEIDREHAETFAWQVLDRFANPFVHHELLSIALQQTSKMDVRVVPSLVRYHRKTGRLPEGILLGFAAFLMFVIGEGRAGRANLPDDERSDRVREHLTASDDAESFVRRVAADRELWHHPLDEIPGFCAAVSNRLTALRLDGVENTLKVFLASKNGQRA